MLFIIFVICCTLISQINCAPTPQQEGELLQPPVFDIESLAQRFGLPQGFSAPNPNRDSRQTFSDNEFGVVRYFVEVNDLSYRFT